MPDLGQLGGELLLVSSAFHHHAELPLAELLILWSAWSCQSSRSCGVHPGPCCHQRALQVPPSSCRTLLGNHQLVGEVDVENLPTDYGQLQSPCVLEGLAAVVLPPARSRGRSTPLKPRLGSMATVAARRKTGGSGYSMHRNGCTTAINPFTH